MDSIKLIIIMFAAVAVQQFASAQQPCKEDDLVAISGSWKKRTDANVFPDPSFPRSQFPEVSSRIDKMQRLLQACYQSPKGLEAGWYRSISGNALVENGPLPFELCTLFLAYYCNGNTKELADETDNWFYIWANQLNWFADRVSYYTINKQPVYLLTSRAGQLNGAVLYNGIHNSHSNALNTRSCAQIFTREGQMPYTPVTRKQFLHAILKLEAFQFNKNYEGVDKSMVVKSPAEAARKEEALAKAKQLYGANTRAANDFLASSTETDLSQPAIVDDPGSFKKFSSSDKGGRELVRLNPDYFKLSLPRYAAQFIIVYWRWDDHMAGKLLNKQLTEHFDFNALKLMIDK